MKSLSLSKPHVVVMVGLPGAGKSFFASNFAETFHAPYISADIIRSCLTEQPTYSQEEDETVQVITSYALNQLLKTQRTLVYDGASSTRSERVELYKLCKTAGYNVLTVWVQTAPSISKERATRKRKNYSPLTPEQYDAKERRFAEPSQSEPVVVVSGKHTFSTQLRAVLKRLVEPRAELAQHQSKPQPRPNGRNFLLR